MFCQYLKIDFLFIKMLLEKFVDVVEKNKIKIAFFILIWFFLIRLDCNVFSNFTMFPID